MYADKMSVDELSLNEMSVDEMTLPKFLVIYDIPLLSSFRAKKGRILKNCLLGLHNQEVCP